MDPGPTVVAGYPNFYHHTATPGAKRAMLERGINPMAMVKAVDRPRRPAILISSSPHKIGSAEMVRAFYYTALLENEEYSPIRPLVDWLDYNGLPTGSRRSSREGQKTIPTRSQSAWPRRAIGMCSCKRN